jgi:hypothetical protein
MAAFSGANGAIPAAIRSALTNTGHPASLGKNSCAKVVFPAPFGPAMMMMRGGVSIDHFTFFMGYEAGWRFCLLVELAGILL